MKIGFVTLVILMVLGTSGKTQTSVQKNVLGQKVRSGKASFFMITPPLSQWDSSQNYRINKSREKEGRHAYPFETFTKTSEFFDGALQAEMGSRTMKTLQVNFDGQSDVGAPPDPTGAAGPNHYVQAVNASFRVYDKNGTPLSGELALATLWPWDPNPSMFGCDPVVMYDRHADRWFISQLLYQPDRIAIAISQTGDPLGSYYLYMFDYLGFPDYPKYSIWWDGYYMTANSDQGSNETMSVFERTEMLAGNPNAQYITLTASVAPWMTLPADADGPLPPNGTPCYLFDFYDDQSGTSDYIGIYEMTTDWATPSNTQIIASQQVPVAPFDINYQLIQETVAQPMSFQNIDGLPGFPCIRAQHIRWVGYNTIILTQTVFSDPNTLGVRWYELRDAEDGNWSLYQQGTFAPDATNRWFGSAAMDQNGNIALAYSVCDNGTGIYPGIRYTGRLANDPLGEMTFTEQIAVNGLSSQSGSSRYGDYSHMSLDPNGTTLWFTGEYIGQAGEARTRIFAISVEDWDTTGSVGYKQNDLNRIEFHLNLTDQWIYVELGKVQTEQALTIDLIDLNGKVLQSEIKTAENGALTHAFNREGLPTGIYFVRVGNSQFQKVERFVLAVSK